MAVVASYLSGVSLCVGTARPQHAPTHAQERKTYETGNAVETVLGGAMLLLMLGGVMACHMVDDDQPTAPTMKGNSANLSNFIIGDLDVREWGGQYVKNNTYFMVNIPITGAIKVEYAIQGGGRFALFVETTMPTKWEIGLTTVDGVTAVLERVCVTYVEHGAFISVPANHEKATQHDATHYQRTLEGGGVENWWPVDAAFKFGGKTTTVCVVIDGLVQGAEVAGPFEKATPAPAPVPVAPTVGGSMTRGKRVWHINGDTGVVTPMNWCSVIVRNHSSTPITVTFTGGSYPGTRTIAPIDDADGTESDDAAGCPVSWSYGSYSGSMTVGSYDWIINSAGGVELPIDCAVGLYNSGKTNSITVSFTQGSHSYLMTILPLSSYTTWGEDLDNCPISWTLVK